MRSLLTLSLLALLAAPALAADEKKDDKKPGPQPIKVVTLDRKDAVSYEKEVEPIFVNKCQFCHSGPVKEGKLDLGSFETLMKGGKSGKVIVPGKTRTSDLGGLAAAMPHTAFACMIGALAIAAFPLTSGFVAKSMIIDAAAKQHLAGVWIALMAVSAGVVLHAGLRLPWLVFFSAPLRDLPASHAPVCRSGVRQCVSLFMLGPTFQP